MWPSDSRSNWNLAKMVFERGKPEKILSEHGWEPTTNSTHIWRRARESNPGHIGGRRVLLPLRHPWTPPPDKNQQQTKPTYTCIPTESDYSFSDGVINSTLSPYHLLPLQFYRYLALSLLPRELLLVVCLRKKETAGIGPRQTAQQTPALKVPLV